MDVFDHFFLTILWIFALVAYLIILFFILSDLFRDSELSGWWKAVWIVFLIFLPFLTALVYLIARGPGARRRALEGAAAERQAQDQYVRSVINQQSPADAIASAKALLESGAIDQAEYEQLKARALS